MTPCSSVRALAVIAGERACGSTRMKLAGRAGARRRGRGASPSARRPSRPRARPAPRRVSVERALRARAARGRTSVQTRSRSQLGRVRRRRGGSTSATSCCCSPRAAPLSPEAGRGTRRAAPSCGSFLRATSAAVSPCALEHLRAARRRRSSSDAQKVRSSSAAAALRGGRRRGGRARAGERGEERGWRARTALRIGTSGRSRSRRSTTDGSPAGSDGRGSSPSPVGK